MASTACDKAYNIPVQWPGVLSDPQILHAVEPGQPLDLQRDALASTNSSHARTVLTLSAGAGTACLMFQISARQGSQGHHSAGHQVRGPSDVDGSCAAALVLDQTSADGPNSSKSLSNSSAKSQHRQGISLTRRGVQLAPTNASPRYRACEKYSLWFRDGYIVGVED